MYFRKICDIIQGINVKEEWRILRRTDISPFSVRSINGLINIPTSISQSKLLSDCRQSTESEGLVKFQTKFMFN